MRATFAVLFAATLASVGMANAADGCGPGCHTARNGGCVVDGWERGARVRNECPVGAHPRPPCYRWFIWSRRDGACIISPN
jgi:hypothetical protein